MVGAGIIGASVAYHAARLGATVTIVDKALPGTGATGESFGWIGASQRVPGPGGALRAVATQEYRRLAAELPDVRVSWRGSLQWGGPEPLGDLEPGRHLVDAEQVAAMEPNLRTPPARAVHIPGDGAVDPPAITDALVSAARARGGRLEAGTAATRLRVARGRVVGVETTSGLLESGTVVLANGADVAVLCGPLGVAVPVAPSPAILLRLAGPPDLVRTVVATRDVEVRTARDGELVSAVGYAGETTAAELARSAGRIRGRISEMFRGGEEVRLLGARVGMRPMPADGHPVIGPLPTVRGAYVAAMHSGVTLAAVAGRLVAEEIVHGVDAPELRGCRPR
ncbi:glycine/D-amino acid oxidase-like deaminating enzyme [Pseudonocardia hierapolitana]|uniref:Glycine/D-amino acid oxidase-like deaminating enzyme n=1 Tax=Pseudonocardia hierapolitana TaxID=1128676 RepID=A0A561SUB9_9PSEU|nr:glycine/D-amino acid oxidase-like deaminating enzyme [Pseudonocardia hierapolitana]